LWALLSQNTIEYHRYLYHVTIDLCLIRYKPWYLWHFVKAGSLAEDHWRAVSKQGSLSSCRYCHWGNCLYIYSIGLEFQLKGEKFYEEWALLQCFERSYDLLWFFFLFFEQNTAFISSNSVITKKLFHDLFYEALSFKKWTEFEVVIASAWYIALVLKFKT
jgi:hypothetical protein